MNAIIFIPGYKGSKLRNKETGETVFLEFKHLFADSLLGFDITGESNNIVSAGVLDELSVLFLKIDICKGFINEMENMGADFKLFNFDYDWRIDIMDHIKKLDAFVSEIEDQFENIYFICHSLGAYLFCYYLKYGTQEPGGAKEKWHASKKINKIVLMAVPFKGIQVAFKDLHYNDGLLWNKKLFHKNISRTYPAVYQLFPQYEDSLLDEKGNGIDLFNIENWKKNGFSFWGEDFRDASYVEKYEKFLGEQLEKSKFFCNKINNSKKAVPEHCRILNIIGTEKPTPRQYVWDNSKKKLVVKGAEYSQYSFTKDTDGDGDGLILSETAKLPDCYRNKNTEEIYEAGGHADFFKNEKIIGRIKRFLKE